MISSLNAIALLRKKINFLVAIFNNSKEVRENPAYTRRLNQICSQISVLENQPKQNEFYSDIATLNMLSTATQGFEALQTLLKEIKVIETANKKRGPFDEEMVHNLLGNNQMAM